MLVIEFLLFFFADGHFGTDFLADYLLGDDLVAHVLLEILKRDSLAGSGLLQIFHRVEVHLLAHFVELFDQLGVAGNAQVFAFFQQQLLIDEIAQHVFILFSDNLFGVSRVLLLRLLAQLLLATLELGAGNDLVIDAGDDFLDHPVHAQGGQDCEAEKKDAG